MFTVESNMVNMNLTDQTVTLTILVKYYPVLGGSIE